MDESDTKVDVLISGAGPVGLFFALRMKANGHTFHIIDMKEEATHEMRAVSLSARTIETLQNCQLAHYILQEALILQGTQLIANGKKKGQLDMVGDTNFPQITSIPQRETEKIFAGILGHEKINRHTELVEYSQYEKGVEAVVKDLHTGKKETIHARYIVGADGVHSAVRKLADDWTFDGFSMSTRFAIGDVAIEGKDMNHISQTRSTMMVTSNVIGGFIPVGEQDNGLFYYRFFINLGRYELEVDDSRNRAVTHGIDRDDSISLEKIQDLVNEGMTPLDVKIKEPRNLSVFRINERKANGYRRNRAFLVGDAAHCHSPAGGQGLNLGIQDAYNLAWKLSIVLDGQSSDPEKLLNSYTVEREPIVSSTMRGTSSSAKMNIIRSGLIALLAPLLTSFVFITKPLVTRMMQLHTTIPKESAILFESNSSSSNKDSLSMLPGEFMRDTVALRKRIINNQPLERKTLHDVFQTERSQHAIIWVSSRPTSCEPCQWNQDFWDKYNTYFGRLNTTVRPILIESTVHAARCRTPSYVDVNNHYGNAVEQTFWTEDKWDVQNSLTKRIGLDKYMQHKPEPPAAIVIVRPDLYVAYCELVKSPSDIDSAFEFLGSYLISDVDK